MTITYKLTLDEALAKRFEKIMADVQDYTATEPYHLATDIFLLLREVIVPDFKRFLADGGYEIAEIKEPVRPKYSGCNGASCCDLCAGDKCCAGYEDDPRYDDADAD